LAPQGYAIVSEGVSILRILLRQRIACILLFLLTFPTLSVAEDDLHDLEIDEPNLSAALLEFSKQSGIQLVIPDRILRGHDAQPISGSYTASAALQRLLADTDLIFEFVDNVTAIIREPDPPIENVARHTFGQRSDFSKYGRQGPDTLGDTGRPIENIIVTGARIPRTDTSPASPVTILFMDDFRFSDSRNAEAVINDLPQAIPDGTATTNNTGPNNGSATIDLRGFGAARTLVLLNGRRIVGSTIDTTVDINGVPPGMIERIDVVTGGASAAYGSDALAGVVNFILREDYVGAEIEAGYSTTDHGDGEKYTLNGAYGVTFNDERTNFNMFFDLAKREPVLEMDRSLFSGDLIPFNGRFVPGGSRNLPGGLIEDVGSDLLLDPADLSSAELEHFTANFPLEAGGRIVLSPHIRLDPNGNPLPFNDPTDRYSTTPFVFLQIPQERAVTSFRVSHDLSSSLSVFADVLYSYNQIDRALSPVAFGDLRIPENNPFITPALHSILEAREIPDADNYFEMRLRVPESGSRTRSNRREVIRVVTGASGSIFDRWDWEAFANFGRMDFVEVEGRSGLRSRIQSALGCPVAGNDFDGDFVPDQCPATPVFPDGVQINPFGAGNILSDELSFFLADDVENRTDVTQFQTGVSFVGKGITLPAGSIGWAWGAEYRNETGSFVPDLLIRNPDIVGSSIESPTSGSFDVFEVFGEMYAPIFQNTSTGNSLGINAAFRLADYSTVGNATNWKIGVEWTATPHVRLRGQYQSAIRAPNIEELFTERKQTYPRFIDPCAGATDELRVACIAVGVDENDIDGLTAGQRQIPVFQSGNTDLHQEQARTITAGVVLEPLLASDLRISLDYFKISVDDAVSILSTSETANLCLKASDPNHPTCMRIARGSDSAVIGIEQFFENIAFIKREGVDLEIGYETPLSIGAIGASDGILDLRLLGTWMLSAASRATPSSPTVDCAGFVSGSVCGRAFPELKTQFRMHYESGKIGLNLRWLHIGAVQDAKVLVTPGNPPVNSRIEAKNYFDLGVEANVSENVSLLAGIINLTDENPPLLESQVDARTDPATYDVIGRRYYVSARLRF
jgi:outer membrane receptor protein involved in Fe transport